jgi:hypothetical protein
MTTENKYTQLCVWPGTILGENEVNDFEQWIKDTFDTRVKYHTEVKTKPDTDENGDTVPNTGGRNDLFFYVHSDDIDKFAVKRLQIGIRWWEDMIVYNDNTHLYSEEFIKEHPPTW